jgi:hypothetical protein
MNNIAWHLLKTDCQPHQVDRSGETALGWACFKNSIDIARILVEMGCDSTIKHGDNFTAFAYIFMNHKSSPNDKYIRLLFAMRGCRDPTPTQLSNSMFNDEDEDEDEDGITHAGYLCCYTLQHLIDRSIMQTRVFRRWAVCSRLTRLTRRIPRGPIGIILGYL